MTDKYKFTIVGKDATKRAFASVTNRIGKIGNALKSTQAKILSILGVGTFGLLIKNSLQVVDALAKTSDRLGVATEQLAGMRFAAEQTGASTQALEMGLQRMTRRLAQVASTGSGEAKVALEQLNLEAEQLARLRPEQQFKAIADAISRVETQGQRVFLTQKLFDSEGVKLLNTLQLGSEGINKLIRDAEDLGIAINRVDAAKIEAANDAINRARKRIEGFGQTVTVAIAPFLEAAADEMTNLSGTGEDTGKALAATFRTAAKVIGVFADGIRGLQVIFKIVKVAAIGFAGAVIGALKLISEGVAGFGNLLKDNLLAPIRGALKLAQFFKVDIPDNILEAFERVDKGFKFKTPDVINKAFDDITNKIRETNRELHLLALEELPSFAIERRLESIIVKADEAAKRIAETIKKSQQETISEPTLLTDVRTIDDEQLQAELRAANRAAEISQIEDLNRTEQKRATEQMQRERGLFALSTALATKSSKIQKALAIRDLIQHTFPAAMGAYRALSSIPFVGPALGAAAFATVMATGAAALRSAQSDRISVGGVSGGAGGGSFNNATLNTQPQQQQIVEIRGLSELREELRENRDQLIPTEFMERLVIALDENARLQGGT